MSRDARREARMKEHAERMAMYQQRLEATRQLTAAVMAAKRNRDDNPVIATVGGVRASTTYYAAYLGG